MDWPFINMTDKNPLLFWKGRYSVDISLAGGCKTRIRIGLSKHKNLFFRINKRLGLSKEEGIKLPIHLSPIFQTRQRVVYRPPWALFEYNLNHLLSQAAHIIQIWRVVDEPPLSPIEGAINVHLKFYEMSTNRIVS